MKLQATIWAAFIAAALAFGLGVQPSRAQWTEPLRIGNTTPLHDVFGRTLDAKALVESSRVDIFSVELKKPQKLLTNTVVGADAEPGYGYFSVTLPKRPEPGSTIRAVVYDAATSNDASFFCSARATVPASGRLLLDFGTPQRASKFDSDDDAWADALERLHASGVDSDEDGMSDYAEYLAGTDLEDSASLLAFESIEPVSAAAEGTRAAAGTTTVHLRWQSVPGRIYQIQYTPSLLPQEENTHVVWEDVGEPITADAYETSHPVEVELDGEISTLRGHFRLLLVL